MSFAVFLHRSNSIYDDSPAEKYQFPRRYLSTAKASEGDWIVYLEPRRATNPRGYFAVAKVQEIIPDPSTLDMHLAIIEPGSYLDFAEPVPFNGPDGIAERGLLTPEGRVSGLRQSAIRKLSPPDFHRIVGMGLGEPDDVLPRVGDSTSGFEDEQAPFVYEQERTRVSQLISRALRDRVFRRIVLKAYDQRCAISGLKLINGGGRAEVAAAHIRPVEERGPDILTNGIALSGTAHWMFDRGLISLSDNLEILVSRQMNDPASARMMINPTGRALAPQRISERPHPRFLEWHRTERFKH